MANATAMILMLLGLLALFLGARNLRVLQNKHALPKKRIPRNDKPFNRPEDVRPEIQR